MLTYKKVLYTTGGAMIYHTYSKHYGWQFKDRELFFVLPLLIESYISIKQKKREEIKRKETITNNQAADLTMSHSCDRQDD